MRLFDIAGRGKAALAVYLTVEPNRSAVALPLHILPHPGCNWSTLIIRYSALLLVLEVMARLEDNFLKMQKNMEKRIDTLSNDILSIFVSKGVNEDGFGVGNNPSGRPWYYHLYKKPAPGEPTRRTPGEPTRRTREEI